MEFFLSYFLVKKWLRSGFLGLKNLDFDFSITKATYANRVVLPM